MVNTPPMKIVALVYCLLKHCSLYPFRHLTEHLDHMVNQDQRDTKHMTDDEVQFHYFKLHDYDDNNMLDGLELVSALTHYHKDNSGM